MLEREEKIFVDLLRFFARLFEQTLALHERIVQLAYSRAQFPGPVDDQFENIDERVVRRGFVSPAAPALLGNA